LPRALGHYIGKSETQLRAAWQTVADFIEAEAAKEAQPVTAIPVRSRRRVQRGATVPDVADASSTIARSAGTFERRS